MITEIKQPYTKITGKSLINNSQLIVFPLLKDNAIKFFNIFRSYRLNELDVNFFIIHEAENFERWDYLSNKYYETPYLWWVIPLANNITNPFELPEQGDNIRILKKDYVYELLTEMRI